MRVPANASVLQALSGVGGASRPTGPAPSAKAGATEPAPGRLPPLNLPEEPPRLASGTPIRRGMFLDILV